MSSSFYLIKKKHKTELFLVLNILWSSSLANASEGFNIFVDVVEIVVDLLNPVGSVPVCIEHQLVLVVSKLHFLSLFQIYYLLFTLHSFFLILFACMCTYKLQQQL